MKQKILSIFLLFFISCASFNNLDDKKYYSNLTSRGIIAVLPFENESNDLTAPDMLRDMVISSFAKKGWDVIKKETVDEKLRSIGITDGGQLPAVEVKELYELLNVNYLCYGYIHDFNMQNLGYIIKKNVEIEIKIVKADTGEVVFDEAGKGRDIKIYTNSDDAKKAFLENAAIKLVSDIVNRPLYKQSEEAINKIFVKIP
ncbi:MAG: DUF799 family lipoprotein [Elusimicrobiales bacterium]|nr:DUF799 family lipoprotein [Elusimicrobiales bacterium]